MLTVIDEFTRRCMAIVVDRRLNPDNVLHSLTGLFVQHGPPNYIRFDNGSKFTAQAVREWLRRVGVKTLYIEPGLPWERRLFWTPHRHHRKKKIDQKTDHSKSPLDPSTPSSLTPKKNKLDPPL